MNADVMDMLAQALGESAYEAEAIDPNEAENLKTVNALLQQKLMLLFENGQLLEHKYPQWSNLKISGKTAIFLEYIDPIKAWEDSAIVDTKDYFGNNTAETFDCRIGLFRDGKKFMTYLANSAEWKLAE